MNNNFSLARGSQTKFEASRLESAEWQISESGLQSLDYLIRPVDQGRGHQQHWSCPESFVLVSAQEMAISDLSL